MTKATIQAIVDEVGGPEHVVGLRGANGTKFYFSKYALSMDDFVEIEGTEILKLKHTDTMGRDAVSYLIVDEIVQVYTVVDTTKKIYIRDFME